MALPLAGRVARRSATRQRWSETIPPPAVPSQPRSISSSWVSRASAMVVTAPRRISASERVSPGETVVRSGTASCSVLIRPIPP